jgi:hypothetical protein
MKTIDFGPTLTLERKRLQPRKKYRNAAARAGAENQARPLRSLSSRAPVVRLEISGDQEEQSACELGNDDDDGQIMITTGRPADLGGWP